MDTKTKVKDIIIKLLKVKPEELKDGQSLEQCLGVDSTEMVEIVIALQKEFGVKIEEKEIAKQQSVEEIANLMASKKK